MNALGIHESGVGDCALKNILVTQAVRENARVYESHEWSTYPHACNRPIMCFRSFARVANDKPTSIRWNHIFLAKCRFGTSWSWLGKYASDRAHSFLCKPPSMESNAGQVSGCLSRGISRCRFVWNFQFRTPLQTSFAAIPKIIRQNEWQPWNELSSSFIVESMPIMSAFSSYFETARRCLFHTVSGTTSMH